VTAANIAQINEDCFVGASLRLVDSAGFLAAKIGHEVFQLEIPTPILTLLKHFECGSHMSRTNGYWDFHWIHKRRTGCYPKITVKDFLSVWSNISIAILVDLWISTVDVDFPFYVENQFATGKGCGNYELVSFNELFG
jgi:hypothetical protein